jgi:hypothetical protein
MMGLVGKEDSNSMPRCLQVWALIEEKAQQRAQKRFEEIVKKEKAVKGANHVAAGDSCRGILQREDL